MTAQQTKAAARKARQDPRYKTHTPEYYSKRRMRVIEKAKAISARRANMSARKASR